MGTVYMLHFSRPYQHARHYVGWTSGSVKARLRLHTAGSGARLIAVITAAGLTFTLARTRPGGRADERRIKRSGGQVRYCPICSPRPRGGPWIPDGGNAP